MKTKLLFYLFLSVTTLSMHAQNVTYHGSKHYNMRVNQFKQEALCQIMQLLCWVIVIPNTGKTGIVFSKREKDYQ